MTSFPDTEKLLLAMLESSPHDRISAREAILCMRNILYGPVGNEKEEAVCIICIVNEHANLHFAQVESAILSVAPHVELQALRWLDPKNLFQVTFFPMAVSEVMLSQIKLALRDVAGIVDLFN